jgi:hypothetical protein
MPDADAGPTWVAACTATTPPAFRHAAFYATLQDDAKSFSVANGDWLEDQGDATFYGLAFYGRAQTNPDRYAAAKARSLSLMAHADFLNDDLQELMMAPLGIIDDIDGSGDRSTQPVLDDFMARLDDLVKTFGGYVEIGGDRSWAMKTYGPTTISALVGLVNVQYALFVKGDFVNDRVAFAVQQEKVITQNAWNGSFYRFSPTEERLDLYPNVAMMALLVRLYQLTGDPSYRTRATALYDAVQPLKLSLAPVQRYYTPYSAAAMGATSTDYSTLSNHNYLTLALYLLHEITCDPKYVEEADRVVDAMSQLRGKWCLSNVHKGACTPGCTGTDVCLASACTPDRCSEGVLHHWIDGRVALPTDPEFFCSGCNMQLLWTLWYRQERIGKGVRPLVPSTPIAFDAGDGT